MSELIVGNANKIHIRWHLLATVSGLVLAASACSSIQAQADGDSRPTVWIDLGGQLERVSNTQDVFTAPFLQGEQPLEPSPFTPIFPEATPMGQPLGTFDRTQPIQAQRPPKFEFGGEAKISFMPNGTNWEFSASARFGRASGGRHMRQQTSDRNSFYVGSPDNIVTPNVVRFSGASEKYNQTHLIADFQAGRDVGLGLLGARTESIISAGVRFAQFTSRSAVSVNEDPNVQVYFYKKYGVVNHYHTRFQTYALSGHSERSFHGTGPSLSWKGSTPIAGNLDAGELALDWGVNGSVLFGRQKARIDHKTTAHDRYNNPLLTNAGSSGLKVLRYQHSTSNDRARSVIVPNIGAFVGLSARYDNAKVSFGYRGDFFFGAMDAGIDSRHSEDMSFYGPFAKISIGLGG